MRRTPGASVFFLLSDATFSIDDALASVLRQSFTDWELLFVDCGAGEAACGRAKEIAQQHGCRAGYHHASESASIPAALNQTMLDARGEFIAFIHPDDLWLPEHLERQITILRGAPYLGYSISPAQWKARDSNLPIQIAENVNHGEQAPGAFLAKILQGDDGASSSVLTVRAELARSIGGLDVAFSGELELFATQAFFAKVALAARGHVQSDATVVLGLHEGSPDLTIGPDQLLAGRVRLYEWLLAYLVKPAARPGRSRLLKTMVRYRLFDTLGRLSRRPPGDAREGDQQSRERRANQRSVGMLFAGIDRLGALHMRAPAAAARAAFNVSIVAYERGAAHGAKLVTEYLTRSVGRMLPRALRPARKQVVATKGGVKYGGAGSPILGRHWGDYRGMSINRLFIEEFLEEFASDIRGECLEFQGDDYTSRFGGKRVSRLDILHIDSSNPHATIVADLTQPNEIPGAHFDTIICTQAIHLIFNVQRAVAELHRVLKPGGVLLVTAPQGGMIARGWTEYWRFTSDGLRRLLAESFGPEQITTRCYGNSLTTAGALRGLEAHDFTPAQLSYHDPRCSLVVCARARKK